MNNISLSINKDDVRILEAYAEEHHMTVSDFVKEVVLDKIEDNIKSEEENMMRAKELYQKQKEDDTTDVLGFLEV